MGIAALVTWLLTAVGGFVMLGIWIARGSRRTSRFSPGLIFGHFADPYLESPEAVLRTKVLTTVVGGDVRWRRI